LDSAPLFGPLQIAQPINYL